MPKKIDAAKAYEGGREYTVGAMKVYSVNLTPDDTGLKGWSAAGIVKVIKMGLDRNGARICSPMRALPGMTDQDATDIANYLLSLPPKANMIPMQCTAM
jgi:hypothetical protein